MRTLNTINGLVLSKFFNKPFYMHLYVTRKCNLRCRMCNVWRHADNKEMNVEEMKVAARKIKLLGTHQVVLTGGEPLLRSDIYEIISIFSELGITTRLQTNALLLNEEKLDRLIESGLSNLTISLHSLHNERLNYIYGITSKAITDHIVKMLKLALKKMPDNMLVSNTVVSHYNLDELINIIKYSDFIGAWSAFVPVNLSVREDELFKAKAADFVFTKEDKEKVEPIYLEILQLKKQGYRILDSTKFIQQSVNFIKTGRKKWKCDAGKLYYCIYPSGEFSACDDFRGKMNILDEDFTEKYFSKEYNEYLENLQNNCQGCFYGCFREISSIIHEPGMVVDRCVTLARIKKRNIFGWTS
ncbi:MAG: radical SAM protein [bacterium]|nr:MAG: radical SAM protein [bacterium]